MISDVSRRTADLEWTGRWARALLVLLLVPGSCVGPIFITVGWINAPIPGYGPAPLLFCVPFFLIQLRLCLAVADGVRLRTAPVLVLVVSLLVLVPMLWFPFSNWAPALWVMLTAVLAGVHGWAQVLGLAVPGVLLTWRMVHELRYGLEVTFVGVVEYSLLIVFYYVAAYIAYGAARLVRTLDELHDTRTELAELAISRERLRLSRDLHDLLGQSLSAVSLKGDLAKRLVDDGDLPSARVHVVELTEVARRASERLREVTSDKHAVSLRTELDTAAALLSAAEVDAGVTPAVPQLPEPIEAALAWSVREGVTNVLRHSAARTVNIGLDRRDDVVRLEIVNDGALPGPLGDGIGLPGLAHRVRELGGWLSAGFTTGERFRLAVEIPLHR